MERLEHQNISGKAYQVLLEMIVSRKLKPGERLVEEQLAKNLGVSRTPLREAINRLSKDGLVLLQARKGASVREFEIDDVVEVYDIRMALEGLAANLAASNIDLKKLKKLERLFESSEAKDLLKADAQLHDLIISSCGNNRLIIALNDLKNFIEMFRIAGYTFTMRSIVATSDHLKILEALKNRDGQQTETLMRKHIEKTKEGILESFREKKAI